MRITTQMINEGARKAGLPIHGNSLLNHIKKDTAKSFVDTYNSTIKQLKSSDSALDMYYKEMFDEVMSENQGALEHIGITLSSKGTFTLDETKMMDADIDIDTRMYIAI